MRRKRTLPAVVRGLRSVSKTLACTMMCDVPRLEGPAPLVEWGTGVQALPWRSPELIRLQQGCRYRSIVAGDGVSGVAESKLMCACVRLCRLSGFE